MKIRVTLIGPGGELDRRDFEAPLADYQDTIVEIISGWTLAPGDIIKIDEVE